MHKSDTYTVVYAAGICLISSLMLAGASAGLKAQQDRMVELDRKFNVLKAFQAPVVDPATKKRATAEVIEKLYAENVHELVLDPATATPLEGKRPSEFAAEQLDGKKVLPLFVWEKDGRPERYALPVSGKGLWSTIYGYLALDGRAERVIGITFYRHGETPGLGGEVEKDFFTKNFTGAMVSADGKPRRLVVAKGSVGGRQTRGDAEYVDGISGATLTGDGVTRFLNADLGRYEPYFAKQRGRTN